MLELFEFESPMNLKLQHAKVSIHLKMYIHNLDVYNQNCIAYCLVVLLLMVFTCEYSYEFTYEYHHHLHTNCIYFTHRISIHKMVHFFSILY